MADKFGKLDESDLDSPVLKIFKPSTSNSQSISNDQSSLSTAIIDNQPSTSTGITRNNSVNNDLLNPDTTTKTTNLNTNSKTTANTSNNSNSQQNDLKRKQPSSIHRGCFMVNERQRGNPLLKSIQMNSYTFDKIIPDYILNTSTCALFLSLKYHNMYPKYIYDRMNAVGNKYSLKILLVLVDVLDANHSLKEMVKICSLADFAFMCAWSYEDAGRILDTYKCFEYKSPESIMDKKLSSKTNDYQCNLDALSSIKSISKTDSISLLSTFKSIENIIRSSRKQLEMCPGLGPTKAEALCNFFDKPFKR